MIIKKITEGVVVQSFDTETKQFVGQEFRAGDTCAWMREDEMNYVRTSEEPCLQGKQPYLPFDMIQP